MDDGAAAGGLQTRAEAAAARAEDPGPFAFASEARVHRILGEAGFSGIAMEPCNLALDVAIGRGLDAAVEAVLEIGPANRALEGQPPDVRDGREAIRSARRWRHSPADSRCGLADRSGW